MKKLLTTLALVIALGSIAHAQVGTSVIRDGGDSLRGTTAETTVVSIDAWAELYSWVYAQEAGSDTADTIVKASIYYDIAVDPDNQGWIALDSTVGITTSGAGTTQRMVDTVFREGTRPIARWLRVRALGLSPNGNHGILRLLFAYRWWPRR